MLIFLTILGGVALIQYGVRTLRKAADRIFGAQIGPMLQGMARTPGRAIFGGFATSLLVPSSTGLSSLAVQTVQSGYILPREMLAVLLGADIGQTAVSQILAFRAEQFAPLLILVGIVLYQYTERPQSKGAGQMMLSFGLLFIGIGFIQGAAGAFDSHGDLAQMLAITERSPVRVTIFAAILAVLFQSSTATVGLFIGLAASGNMPLSTQSVIAGVIGANLGVAFTTLFLGWNQTDSRRMAVANFLSKLLIAAILLSLLPWMANLLDRSPGDFARHVVNAHTGFNVIKLLVVLPLTGIFSKAALFLVPEPLTKSRGFGPRYINDGPIEGGSLALGQSMREILRVSEIVEGMYGDWWLAFKNNLEPQARQVVNADDQVDLLDREIQRFLTRVAAANLDADQAAEQMRQLRFLSELETIGDVIARPLCELAIKKVKSASNFSGEIWRELEVFERLVAENMVIAETTFHTRDPLLAQKLLRHKDAVNRAAGELRDNHFSRLNRGLVEPHETTAIYLDVLSNLRRINSHAAHAAYAILQNEEAPSPLKQLMEKLEPSPMIGERHPLAAGNRQSGPISHPP